MKPAPGRAAWLASRSGLLRRASERKAAGMPMLLARAGVVGNPSRIATRAVAQAFVVALVALPAAVGLALFVSGPLLLLGLAPLPVYFWPDLRLRDAASQRREGVEKELPLFSVLVNILGGAGVPLYPVLESVTGTGIFESIEREALAVRRDVKILGMNPNDALERLASRHPSRKFSEFINGYTSKVRSGGDVPAYLSSESGSFLREVEETWRRYTEKVGIVGTIMITLFGVIPLLLLVVGAFSLGYSSLGLLVYVGLGIPLFTVMTIALAGRMQPAGEGPLSGKALPSLALSVPAALVGVETGEAWAGAAAAMLVFFVAYGVSVRARLASMREVEEALPAFTKDMMEYKRQDYDLGKALLNASASNRYGPALDAVLARIAAGVRAGVPLDELKPVTDSRLTRMVFFLIGQMSRSGGGSVETMFQISSYAGRAVEMKRAARAEMRPYVVLSYASPLMLAFAVAFVGGILRAFARSASSGLTTLHIGGLQAGAASPLLGQASSLLIVVTAGALGLVGTKMTDFTVKNTLKPSLNVAVAVAAIEVLALLNLGIAL